MARLTVVVDLEDVDTTDTDPWETANDLLDVAATLLPGEPFRTVTGEPIRGTFVSAEWTS